jgi:hypothetical protein
VDQLLYSKGIIPLALDQLLRNRVLALLAVDQPLCSKATTRLATDPPLRNRVLALLAVDQPLCSKATTHLAMDRHLRAIATMDQHPGNVPPITIVGVQWELGQAHQTTQVERVHQHHIAAVHQVRNNARATEAMGQRRSVHLVHLIVQLGKTHITSHNVLVVEVSALEARTIKAHVQVQDPITTTIIMDQEPKNAARLSSKRSQLDPFLCHHRSSSKT